MTECDFHPSYRDAGGSSSESLGSPRIIQDELIWGLSYRQIKKREKEVPLPTKGSPLDIPFKICREKERQRRLRRMLSSDDEKNVEDDVKTPAEKKTGAGDTETRKGSRDQKSRKEKEDQTKKEKEDKLKKGKDDKSKKEKEEKPGKEKDASKKGTKKPKKKKPPKKLTLLERSVLTQNEYMNYLSIPNTPTQQSAKRRKCPTPCYLEPCPPRIVQLSVPNKRSVFANWKAYYDSLPVDMIVRFEKILHTDKNLEPREARYYYKKLDKKKRKALRRKRRLLKKKKAEKERGDQAWLKEQIALTVRAIMDYLIDEPLFALNYKQLLLSDGILDRLDQYNILKRPSRNTKSNFNRTVIEISDKIAVWMDILTRFVDIQAVDSDEDLPPVSISSLGEGEGESESSSYYSELEKGLWDEYGEGEGEGRGLGFGLGALLSGLFGEGEGDIDGLLGDLDLDLLEKLIRILSNCSDEYLEGEANSDRIPGVRYLDILNRVKELRDGILKKGPQKPFLEQLMLEWAIRNEPDEIDQKMKGKIHEVAALLGDFLFGAGGLRGRGFGEGFGFGIGEEGEGGDEGFGLGGLGGLGVEAMGRMGAGWGEEEGEEDDEEARRRREEEERRRREEEEERRRREAELRRLAALEAEGGEGGLGTDLADLGKVI